MRLSLFFPPLSLFPTFSLSLSLFLCLFLSVSRFLFLCLVLYPVFRTFSFSFLPSFSLFLPSSLSLSYVPSPGPPQMSRFFKLLSLSISRSSSRHSSLANNCNVDNCISPLNRHSPLEIVNCNVHFQLVERHSPLFLSQSSFCLSLRLSLFAFFLPFITHHSTIVTRHSSLVLVDRHS